MTKRSREESSVKEAENEENTNTAVEQDAYELSDDESSSAPKRQRKQTSRTEFASNLMLHKITYNDLFTVPGVKRIAFNPSKKFCAIGKTNGEIEIWYTPANDVRMWISIKSIPAKENTTIESLIWTADASGEERLFSAGLHGYITEWDLETFTPKQMSDSFGGAIWAMAKHPKKELLATASEDGKVRVYDFSLKQDYSFSFTSSFATKGPENKSLTHCKGHRLQAITFSTDGDKLFTGGFTGVFCYDLKSGGQDFHVRFPDSIVWSLCHLKDGTLIVGDSQGFTTFCDAKFGTVVSKFHEHNADVLQIVTNSKHDTVYSVGVDAKVALFHKAKRGFQSSKGKRPLEHDTHALAMFNDKYIAAGGTDGRVVIIPTESFYQQTGNVLNYYNIDPPRNVAQLSRSTRTMLVDNNDKTLNLLTIPPVTDVKLEEYKTLSNIAFDKPVTSMLRVPTKSEGGWSPSSIALSSNGQFICYSTLDNVFLVKVARNKNIASVADEESLKQYGVVPGHIVHFCDNDTLVVVSRTNDVQIFDVPSKKIVQVLSNLSNVDTVLVSKLKKKKNDNEDANLSSIFKNLIVSVASSEKYLAIALTSSVYVYDLSKKGALTASQPSWELRYQIGIIHKVAFHSDSEFYVLMTNNHVAWCDASSNQQQLAQVMHTTSEHLGAIRFISKLKEGVFFFSTHKETFASSKEGKTIKHLHHQKEFNSILHLECVTPTEGIVLYHNWNRHFSQLPDVCYRHRFGT